MPNHRHLRLPHSIPRSRSAAAIAIALATLLHVAGSVAAPAGPPPAPTVSTLTLVPVDRARSESLPGRIAAFRHSDVRPQVTGMVTERLFEEGSMVQKGQQLYQIDETRYRAILASAVADQRSAEANFKAARSRAERYLALLKSNTVSQQDYDDALAASALAEAGIGVAEAQVELARVDLAYTRIDAPIAGYIGRSRVSVGNLVTANQERALTTITTLDPVYVDMQLPVGQRVQHLLKGEGLADVEVTVVIPITEGSKPMTHPHTGRLKFSEVTTDPATGATTLRAETPNPEGTLLPGMFVHAVLALGEVQSILVPQRATIRTPDGTLLVWVVDQANQVQRRTIEVSGADGNSWVVTSGLLAGDTIVVEGYQRLREGQTVVPDPWSEAPDQNAGADANPNADADGGENASFAYAARTQKAD